MTGNVGLDVFIGLVFVYLLYSLYATIIMEIFSSTFGLRARNLTYAIKRMLMDERKYPNLFLGWLSEFVGTFIQPVGRAINLKDKALYNRFMNQPSIRTLCSGSLSNRPSYIPAEVFSKALIDSIKIDEPDFSVIACIHLGLEDEKRPPVGPETKKLIKSFLRDANNDLVKFQLLLERWYNNTMERSKGWFKRTTQIMLAAIGFTLVIAFNVDSIAVIKKLSNDKEARAQMVNLATEFNEKNAAAIQQLKTSEDTVALSELNARLTSLDTIRRTLEDDIHNSQNILASTWHLPDSIKPYTKKQHGRDSSVLAYITKDGSPIFLLVHKSIDAKVFRQALPNELIKEGSMKINTAYYKFWYAISYDHIWGYLLTVLAISLGAPFWFDLLNKLVKLRTSQPVSTTEQSAGSAAPGPEATKATLNRVG